MRTLRSSVVINKTKVNVEKTAVNDKQTKGAEFTIKRKTTLKTGRKQVT